MKAIVIHAAGDLRIDEAGPAAPGPGEVLVDVLRGGICGSDLHYFQHGGFGTVRLREPMILGHEVAGRIAATGPGVTDLAEGALVAVSPARPCGTCRWCKAGMDNHCENMAFYGSAMRFPHVQGAFRERLVARAGQCVPAEGLTPGAAAMAEPLAVALHAIARAGSISDRSILVTGGGPIGQLVLIAARGLGAGEIVLSDPATFPRDMARRLGADDVVDPAEDDAFARWQAGRGHFDVAFECSGAAGALADAVGALRPRGRLVQLGLGGDLTVPMPSITVKEIEVAGSFRFVDEFAEAVRFMQEGRIDVAPLVTAVRPMNDALAAFREAADRTRAMKVQIDFSGAADARGD